MFEPQRWGEVFAQVSPWAVALAGFLGLLSVFTASALALVPVIIGYVGASARSRAAAWGRALAFLSGLALVTVAMGAGFGVAGALAQQFTGGNLALWNALAGLVTLWVALAALGVVPLPLPEVTAAAAPGAASWAGAFALGIPYGLITCPTCVPVMVPVALGAAASGSAGYGALLFLSFAAGRSIPLLLLGGGAGTLKGLGIISRHLPAVERASALLLAAAGLYFLVQAAAWMVWRAAM